MNAGLARQSVSQLAQDRPEYHTTPNKPRSDPEPSLSHETEV